jgi:hypothetical protein
MTKDQLGRQAAKLFEILETKSLFEAKPEIMELAETCKKSRLWKTHKTEFLDAYKEFDAEKMYNELLHKIDYAPTTAHAYATIVLLVPVLADKLN